MAGRRWELPIAPVLARLGLTRPDENPINLAEEVDGVVLLGNYSHSAASPGSRVCWMCAAVSGAQVGLTVPGGFATAQFFPPASGGFLRQVFIATEDGSYATMGTSNQVVFPAGFVSIGTTQRPFRPDAREEYPNIGSPLIGAAPGPVAMISRFVGWTWSPPMPWWTGALAGGGEAANLIIQGTIANVGFNVTVEFEVPLQGVRRQTNV